MYKSKNIIVQHTKVKDALTCLNALPVKTSRTLFVVNTGNQILGTLTDGDIRRGLISGKSIEDEVELFMNRNFRFLLKDNFDINELEKLKELETEIFPVIDKDGYIVKLIDSHDYTSYLPIEAVIMAGGRGERLKPLTDTVPKPLLKVGDKPIIEHNIDRLKQFGIDNITISIRYLGEQLVEYFKDGHQKNLKIKYVTEDEPLGTIGALKLIPSFEADDILVQNSDLLTNIDFQNFYKKFLNEKAVMAVATIPHQVNIPFGVFETDGEAITSLKEKPTFTYQCNAGIYLIKTKILDWIPVSEKFDATDLIEMLIQKGEKVIFYSIFDYWLDVGTKEDYAKAQNDIKFLKF